MSFFEERGSEVKDQGQRLFFDRDPVTKKQVYLLLRRMPMAVEESYRKRYLKRYRNKRNGKLEYVFDETRALEFVLDRLSWCWCDTENLTVTIMDEEAATFYRDALGNNAQVETGKDLLLDGRLNEAIKRRLLDRFPNLSNFVIEKLQDMNEDNQAQEDEQTENLEPGSNGAIPQATQT